MSKAPTRYESKDGTIAIKLDLEPGDIALITACGPKEQQAAAVFLYPDNTVGIYGLQHKYATIDILQQAIRSLESIPDSEIP